MNVQILFIHSLQELRQETSFKLYSVLKFKKKQSIVMFGLWLANVCLVGFQETFGLSFHRALSRKKFTTACSKSENIDL